MVRLDDRGVADILAIAFMFVILVLAAVFMHTYSLRPLRAATDRQLELKSEHLYMTLELAWVEPYSVSFLRAATENLLLEQPTVPGPHLRSAVENTLEYLCPPRYAVAISLSCDDSSWELSWPEGVGLGIDAEKQFVRQGEVRLTMASGEKIAVPVTVRIFEIDGT
ncbi:unnamed protein product [marine sediment metagenome]|uniref:Uncharacterized protein n=1 Tax=marine sediment metagenome TaxID=412755 RepID=X1GQ80_9ZZZZ